MEARQDDGQVKFYGVFAEGEIVRDTTIFMWTLRIESFPVDRE